jgi:hypothetical protein
MPIVSLLLALSLRASTPAIETLRPATSKSSVSLVSPSLPFPRSELPEPNKKTTRK